jgi:hypothetical protein
MRRLVTALFVTFAVLLSSAALTAFWLQQTVFSPERAATAARHVIASPAVAKLVTDQATQTLTAGLPQPVIAMIGQETIRAAVTKAASDPQVISGLEQTVAKAYRDMVTTGKDQPIVVDGAPMARAIGASLAQISPQVGAAVAASPMQVEVRSTLMADMARAKNAVDTVLVWCAGLALLFAVAAVGVSGNRPGVLQHLGGWMAGVALVQLALTWALPEKILPRFGESGELLGQVASDLTGGVVTVLVALLVAGAAGLVGGRLWSVGRRRSAEALPQSPVQSQPAPEPVHA